MHAEPIGIENFVEPLPIGAPRAKQGSERGPQRSRSRCQRIRENRERVARFRESNLKLVVAQCTGEAREPFANWLADVFSGWTEFGGIHRRILRQPCREAVRLPHV